MKKQLIALLIALCLWLWAIPAQAESVTTAPVIYRDVMAKLETLSIPLRLPQQVAVPPNRVIPGVGYGATLIFGTFRGYSLNIGYSFPCEATACTIARVEAIAKRTDLPKIESMFDLPSEADAARSPESSEWLTLPNEQSVYFTAWPTELGPAFSHLTWDEGKYRYDIALKAGTKAELMAMAESISDKIYSKINDPNLNDSHSR